MLSRREWTIFGIVGLMGALTIYALRPFLVDDAYIVLHTVRHLGEPVDPSFADARPMTGITSPAQMLLIWLVARVMPAEAAQSIVLGLGWTVYLSAIWAMTSGLETRFRLGVLVGSVIAARMPFQMLNGLETTLALGALGWVLVGIRAGRVPWWLSFLIGSLPSIRPEFVLFSVAAIAALALIREWRAIVVASLTALAWIALITVLGGHVPPETIEAKRVFFAGPSPDLRLPFVVALIGVNECSGLLVGLLGLVYSRPLRPFLAAAALLLLAGLASPAVIIMDCGRYLHCLIPLLVVGLTDVLLTNRPLGTVALVAALLWSTAALPHSLADYRYRRAYIDAYAATSAWLVQHPVESPVLIHDAGYLSDTTPYQFVDLVGLKTPFCVGIHRSITAPSRRALAGTAIARIADISQPRTLITQRHFDEAFNVTSGLRADGWTLTPLLTASAASGFDVYRLTAPTR